ncbi:hypothetical protein ES707_07818 [subsurface metagenome]|jgi:uncharacterized membrane protein
MDVDHIDRAIVENYRKLRTRIGVMTLAFPLVLIAWGAWWGLGVQPTLSNYYFATEPLNGRADAFPVRLWFCGFLFAVGVFLYKYQGFSENENRWLSLAGLFVLGVAVFPMSNDGKNDWDFALAWIGLPQLSLHGISAVLAFACIAVVIFWYADSSLSELKDTRPKLYVTLKWAYRGIAAFMAASIAVAIFLHYRHGGQGSYILAAEWCGIWAFAIYWFVKNYELKQVAKALKSKGRQMPRKNLDELADKL